MNRQEQRILNAMNGNHGAAKAYNKGLGQGEEAAKVKIGDSGQKGVVVHADFHRAKVMLESGRLLEVGWPKVELTTM